MGESSGFPRSGLPQVGEVLRPRLKREVSDVGKPARQNRGGCSSLKVMIKTFLLMLGCCAIATQAEEWPLTDVFIGGQEGFAVYRIPALVTTTRGTLLAFAEGRRTQGDQSQNQIVLKRSTDHGATWLPMQTVAADGASSLNNPQAVVVRKSGRVLLMYQRYPPGRREGNVEPGLTGTNICTSWMTQSDDDGMTWSAPRDLTAQIKRATATSLASGPGVGIELRRGPHQGRLIMPFNEGPAGKWRVFAAFSDDGGISWKSGEPAPNASKGHGNEVQMAELTDGSVLLNARNQGGAKLRKIATSRDGGATWSPLKDDPQLPEPVCQASLLRYPNAGAPEKDVLLFCNPASPTKRITGTVRLSRDDGRTWPVSRVLYPGSFAYSCMAPLSDGSVALIFERDGCSRITFCRFTPDGLNGP